MSPSMLNSVHTMLKGSNLDAVHQTKAAEFFPPPSQAWPAGKIGLSHASMRTVLLNAPDELLTKIT